MIHEPVVGHRLSGETGIIDALCWLAHDGWADNVWMLLHDEIILQVPDGRAQEALEALEEAVTLELLGVPIRATGHIAGGQWP